MHGSRDSVDDSDTAEKYSKLLQEHIERFEVVEKVMSGLNDTMVTFHGKVKGDIKKIEALFVDMAPEPQKGKPMPPGTERNRQTAHDRPRLLNVILPVLTCRHDSRPPPSSQDG
jgi:hypothetical protein